MNTDDPLDGANVGETVTITETGEIWVGDFESTACRGSDRLAESRFANVAQTTDEYGDSILEVTVESDVTKCLPRRWDACEQPRTAKELTAIHRATWVKRAMTAASVLIPFGIATAIMTKIGSEISGEISINGEPMVFPTFLELIGPVLLVTVFCFVVMYGIQHLPRGMGARTQ